jgi:hypothetical protein
MREVTNNIRNTRVSILDEYKWSGSVSGVVVSVLTAGPKGGGLEPGQGDGFLRAIKIRSTPSSRMRCKALGPMS